MTTVNSNLINSDSHNLELSIPNGTIKYLIGFLVCLGFFLNTLFILVLFNSTMFILELIFNFFYI